MGPDSEALHKGSLGATEHGETREAAMTILPPLTRTAADAERVARVAHSKEIALGSGPINLAWL